MFQEQPGGRSTNKAIACNPNWRYSRHPLFGIIAQIVVKQIVPGRFMDLAQQRSVN
jgi:hypothetical protein